MADIKNTLLNFNRLRLNKERSESSRKNEFLRVIISENGLYLNHINCGKIQQKIETSLIDKMKIFEYLRKFPQLPLDIIISTNTMSCRSISLNNLSKTDMEALAKNILNGKNGLINLVCYEKKISYRIGVAILCNMKLTPVLSKILQELLNIGNSIRTTITSPLWIVKSYFKTHPNENGKFGAQIFAVNSRFDKEIIVLHDDKYVFYKKILTDNFNEKENIDNAIKFVNQHFNTGMEDIAIYKFDDAALDTFTTNLDTNMKMVSLSENYDVANNVTSLNFMTKSVCLLFLMFLVANTVSNIVKIFGYNNQIHKFKKAANLVDSDIIDEIDLWKNVDKYISLKPLNIKSKLAERFQKSQKKFQNITVKINKKTMQPIFSAVYEND